MTVGDLVVSSDAPSDLFRVANKVASSAFRLLPYERSGGEKVIMAHRGGWTDGAAWWKKI